MSIRKVDEPDARHDDIEARILDGERWDAAAEAWHKWGPTLRKWLGPATERMLDLADVKSGCRVLDVAAGAGDQSLQAAGRVLATDISQLSRPAPSQRR